MPKNRPPLRYAPAAPLTPEERRRFKVGDRVQYHADYHGKAEPGAVVRGTVVSVTEKRVVIMPHGAGKHRSVRPDNLSLLDE